MTKEIVEVRDYTIDADWLDAYRQWATELAVPWLRQHLDLVDFWMEDGYDAEVSGTNAVPPANGQPNVCWIIRWPSKTARDEQFNSIMTQKGWRDIWAKHPNSNAYLQMNVRFMRRVD